MLITGASGCSSKCFPSQFDSGVHRQWDQGPEAGEGDREVEGGQEVRGVHCPHTSV